MTAARGDKHGSGGLHPENVEDEDKIDEIDMYTAAGETFEDELGDQEEGKELEIETEHTRTNIADVPLPLALSQILNAQ